MAVTDNPNAYDDEAYAVASNDTIAAIGAMFAAGAREQDIINDVKAGLENEGCEANVEIDFQHIRT